MTSRLGPLVLSFISERGKGRDELPKLWITLEEERGSNRNLCM